MKSNGLTLAGYEKVRPRIEWRPFRDTNQAQFFAYLLFQCSHEFHGNEDDPKGLRTKV